MADNHSSNSASQRAREQGHSYVAMPGVFCFVIAAFSPFVQVKYQSTDPFEKHNGIMLTFVVAVLVYVVAWAFEVKLRIQDSSYYKIFGNIGLLSGTLATVSLVWILSPFLGWFIFVVWVICFAKLAHDSYQEFYQLLYHATLEVFKILYKLMTIKRSRMTEEGDQGPTRLPI